MNDNEENETTVVSDHHLDGNGSSNFPLVWVLLLTSSEHEHPASQEPALLIEEYDTMSLIEWKHSGERDFVESHRVSRRRKRSIGSSTMNSPSTSSTTSHKRTWKHAASTGTAATATATDDLDTDDDEVQVLLTIFPPSPCKPMVSHTVTPLPQESSTSMTLHAGLEVADVGPDVATVHSHSLEAAENCEHSHVDTPLNRTLWVGSHASATSTSAKTISGAMPLMAETSPALEPTALTESVSPLVSSPRFSSRSSAYLQSLAEICYAILWDVRWRVGGARQDRLLAWERGQDLTAVHALARRYLAIPHPTPISHCQCLLCYQQPKIHVHTTDSNTWTTATTTTTNESPAPSVEGTIALGTDSPSPSEGDRQSDSSATTNTCDEEEAYDRSLNLYARLYSRKGPWFRVDELFKYYIPKRPPPNPPAVNDNEPSSKPSSPTKPKSPSKFFLPKSATKKAHGSRMKQSTRTLDSFIDQEHVNRQLESVSTLLQDLQQLFGMGLLRSFDSEQECGQKIGQVHKYGLLRQEEQRSVLTKLGGVGGGTRNPGLKSNVVDNLIWKQMCQQQSILVQTRSTSESSDKPNTVLLPVAKHVDQALVASWATSLVLLASHVDYIPQGLLRSITNQVQQILHQLLKEHSVGHASAPSGVSLMCLRLREAPLESLRRCCRLYLCATCGPGEMRGDTGNNAWKSLPDESDTAKEQAKDPTIWPTNVVPPPGSHTWHHIVYPGRDYRFKLISCIFQRAHQPLYLKAEDEKNSSPIMANSLTEEETRSVQVFLSLSSFELWELSVELRSNVDYLMEANELSLYNERKRARDDEDERNGRTENPPEDHIPPANDISDDFDDDIYVAELDRQSPLDNLKVLKVSGRGALVSRFASPITGNQHSILQLKQQIEKDVGTLLSFRDPSAASKRNLKNDCEKILGVIAILAVNILSFRNRSACQEDIDFVATRPWLRHMSWEGCLAFLLWDIIPILERRGFYQLATNALEILLFGQFQPREDACQIIPKILEAGESETFLAQSYLSRRARGKAFERLVIDYMHILRQKQKYEVLKEAPVKRRKKKLGSAPMASVPSANDMTAKLCEALLQSCMSSGQITFCAARTLARRMKRPLSETLSNLDVYEINELGHRLSSDNKSGVEPGDVGSKPNGKTAKKYSDWTPNTDYAVANAMATDRNTVGSRCTFVGFEDREEAPTNFGSLNVEELALECYHSGRLPQQQDTDPSTVRGGWVGWHDEGGKLRALFRILSSAEILNTDWGCPNHWDGYSAIQNATIHLTPYQGAPFDLHVGAERTSGSNDVRQGFYRRRRMVIDSFLTRLESLSPAEVADLVHRSIAARFHYTNARRQNDPTLERDVQQARTLSALAAGFGGKMMAAMCRCLFFDYRHYSGGLPDLTLIRAVYEADESHKEESLVDLGSWIGEAFSPDMLAETEAKNAASMFEDKDDEFLGCSKVGDSGRRNTRGGRPKNLPSGQNAEGGTHEVEFTLPNKIVLQHGGRNLRVESMLVEVKSHNDRLDPRQEDWLNVLDQFGNVRVCKFQSTKKRGDI